MDIFKTIGDAIGGFFSNSVVQVAIQAIVIYAVILWLAAAFWAFRDMQLRNENPVLPYLAAALIVLFTPVLFPFGVVVYRIVRPQEKIGDVYERNLAEEALLAEVETVRSCPGCSRRVHEDWIICPSCRTRLNRVCANCGRLVGLDWSLCAWCGKDFERADIAALSPISGGLADTDRLEPTTASRAAFRAPSRVASLRTPPSQPADRAEPERGRGALWSSSSRPAAGPGASGGFPER
jgi:RNA polymerase subunit RPABC4/transcription elongation factor Spt4